MDVEFWERSPVSSSLLAADSHEAWPFAPTLGAARRSFSCRSDRRERPVVGRSRSRRSARTRRLTRPGQYGKFAVLLSAAPGFALHGPTLSSRGSL